MKTLLISAAFAAFAVTGTANAAVTVIDFDAVATGNAVGAFYPGFNFVDWATTSGFGETSAPNLAFNLTPGAYVDVAAGFSSLSFTTGSFIATTVNVWSGLGGTGSLLGSGTFFSPPGAFAPGSVAFSGTAKSITLSGTNGSDFGWDDVTFGAAVPEPASWALMIAGFGMVGAAMRRRKLATA
ncbi:MAG: PEPxxWA-CTERM sorting domain-containing protein [Polymorphobacter sp.]